MNNDVVNLCSRLIKAPSLSGREKEVVEVMHRFCDEQKTGVPRVDEYGNCVVLFEGNRPGRTVLFDAHIDTVPADTAQWSDDPWSGAVKEGRVYGRGASDMKGALAAMLAAAADFVSETEGNFPGRIAVAGVVHEECFEGIAARKISASVQPDLVVIGEASELNLKIGQRGRAEVVVESFGRNAHSANPDKGVNAVYRMAEAVSLIRSILPPEQKELGKGILELTDIKSEPYPGASVVPDYCRATYDRRLLKGETPESVLAPVREALVPLNPPDEEFQVKVRLARAEELCYTGTVISGERFFPAWYYDVNEPFVQCVLDGIRSAGLSPGVTTYSFCTNGSHYAGEAGIPTVGFGPSRENLAHTVDEYIEVEQLEGARRGYAGIMKAYLFS